MKILVNGIPLQGFTTQDIPLGGFGLMGETRRLVYRTLEGFLFSPKATTHRSFTTIGLKRRLIQFLRRAIGLN